jgi:hypothetical protein
MGNSAAAYGGKAEVIVSAEMAAVNLEARNAVSPQTVDVAESGGGAEHRIERLN